MSDIDVNDGSAPILIHTEHGPLHGQLVLPPGASGLIVLAHPGLTPASHDEALAVLLQHKGFATLTLDLLPHKEERFADVHNNVPLLARRLLESLNLIKRQMLDEEIPALPLGLCAAGYASPAIVRVAAQRDHDIAAIACRGGLIDLAGMLYLRSLSSPLLLLVGETDAALIASSQRAMNEIACSKALEVIPKTDSNFDSKPVFETVSGKVAGWFIRYCRLNSKDQMEPPGHRNEA